MKKVSAKLFFTVLWRGLCQVLGWFFGLFGYKTDGKFAKFAKKTENAHLNILCLSFRPPYTR